MDELRTGEFELSTAFNDFWRDWQVELAEKDLRRRARTAFEGVQRDGIPYVTCLYPVEKKDDKLVLTGFFVLAQWQDCEVGEACADDGYTDWGYIARSTGILFDQEAKTYRHHETIYIYRRTK